MTHVQDFRAHPPPSAGCFGSRGTVGLLSARPTIAAEETSENGAIRPFSVHVPEADLVELRKRIAQTRWPTRKPSPISRKGPVGQAAGAGSVLGSGYDWRKAEAKLMPCRNS